MKICGNLFLPTLLIVLLNAKTSENKTIRTIDFQTCNLSGIDWNFVKVFDFKLIKFKSQNALNGSLILLNDLDAFDLDWTLSVRKSNGQVWNLFNISVDGCKFLRGSFSKRLSLTKNIMEQLAHYAGNSIPKKCPLEKAKETRIVNFVLNPKIFPAFFPDVKFMTTVTYKRNKNFIFKISLTGLLETKYVKNVERH